MQVTRATPCAYSPGEFCRDVHEEPKEEAHRANVGHQVSTTARLPDRSRWDSEVGKCQQCHLNPSLTQSNIVSFVCISSAPRLCLQPKSEATPGSQCKSAREMLQSRLACQSSASAAAALLSSSLCSKNETSPTKLGVPAGIG